MVSEKMRRRAVSSLNESYCYDCYNQRACVVALPVVKISVAEYHGHNHEAYASRSNVKISIPKYPTPGSCNDGNIYSVDNYA